ncbi:MAG: S-layer homology domain-containing protein [Clostridiales bacterium]|nr:S-layer homology domain-containing protein [Clostridiales bacterium]
MKKSTYSKIINLVVLTVMLLGMFLLTSFSAATETVSDAITIPTLDEMMEANSPELAEVVAFAEGQIPGYGSNGNFLAPINAPDPDAVKLYTAQDLNNVRNNLSGSYMLMNNIDLADFNSGQWVPIGNASASFTGVFDGQGYVIKNMVISNDGYQYTGLFGAIGGEANIKNVGLEDTNIDLWHSSANHYAGGICGYSSSSGSVINCYNTGHISSYSYSRYSYAGGICGYSSGSIFISNCYNTGDVATAASNYLESFSHAGGICGYSAGSGTVSILNCYNTGNISSSIGDYSDAGGICGRNEARTSISNCYNTGNISSSSPSCSSSNAGGICGNNGTSVFFSNCYNIGTISSSPSSFLLSNAGGICGYSYSGSNTVSIYNCYNTGNISSTSVSNVSTSAGGICGASACKTIVVSNCYNTGNLSSSSFGGSYAGGIYGSNVGGTLASITNCYNTGDVIASSNTTGISSPPHAGGICGYSSIASVLSISNCYNTGDIFSSFSSSSPYNAYSGGICGRIYFSGSSSSGSISNCVVLSNQIHAKNTSNPTNISCYLIGNAGTKTNNLALNGISGNATDDATRRISTREAEYQITYENLGWDFVNIWDMRSGYKYPQLRGLPTAGAFVKTKAIYILPGYMASKLYTSDGEQFWLEGSGMDFSLINGDNILLLADMARNAVNRRSSDAMLNYDGTGSKLYTAYELLNLGIAPSSPDSYGVGNTLEKVVTKLNSNLGGEYEIEFFPYNWLADLNDYVVQLETDISRKGYEEIIFVTHSTGGLLASAYIAKNEVNKRKVDKAILVAAPLFGTYTALAPLETGVGVLFGDKYKLVNSFVQAAKLFEILSIPDWVKALLKLVTRAYDGATNLIKDVTHNSPTTYQILPSEEYLKQVPSAVTDAGGLLMSPKPIDSIDDFYSLLNQSDNINPNLTNGNKRSHRQFRQESLGGDIVQVLPPVFDTITDTLLEVDTMLIYSHSAPKKTPMTATYKDKNFGGGKKLKEITYTNQGDDTIAWISAAAFKITNDKTDKGFVLERSPRSPYSNIGHTELIQDRHVINEIIEKIRGGTTSAAVQIAPESFDIDEGMSNLLKLNYSCDAFIDVSIYDNNQNEVVKVAFDDFFGFDGSDFIYHSYANEPGVTDATIYMPNKGYKVVFSYGDKAGVPVDFICEASTLVADGWKEVSINHRAAVTVAGGVISEFDGTVQAILSSNIGSIVGGTIITHYTDWELPNVRKVNRDDTQNVSIDGSQAAQVAPLLNWFSSDDSIVEVTSNGVFIAKGYGKATISATDGNKTSVCEVTVMQNASTVSLLDNEMIVGKRKLIRPQFTPLTATETVMTYTVSEEGIIEINKYGVIIALDVGTVTVTGSTSYGVNDSFKVSVINKETLRFQLNITAGTGGSITIGASGQYEQGEVISIAAKPNDGYIFTGWMATAGAFASTSSAATTFTMPDRDATITANFEPISVDPDKFALTITAGTGGTITTGASGQYEQGQAINIAAKPNDGYMFIGWITTGGGTFANAGSAATIFTMPAGNASIAATFTPVGGSGGGKTTYTVTFNSNGGSMVSSQTVDAGGKAVKPADPTRTGHDFVDWYTNPAFTMAYDFDKAVTANFTLYANWAIAADTKEVLKPSLTDILRDDGQDPTFHDLPITHWAYQYVEYLARRDFVKGKSTDLFAPDDPITRAEFITVLARMNSEELPAYTGLLTDVKPDSYYAGAVAWGIKTGVTKGTSDTTFTPNRSISRQEIATLLGRYLTYKGITLIDYNQPQSFTDELQIADYAKDFVSTMQKADIINGYPDGSFKPQANATRAEAAKMLAFAHYLMNNRN